MPVKCLWTGGDGVSCTVSSEHFHCPVCVGVLYADGEMCSHHLNLYAFGWSASNKLMCDLLHRGIAPPRLSAVDRTDDGCSTECF